MPRYICAPPSHVQRRDGVDPALVALELALLLARLEVPYAHSAVLGRRGDAASAEGEDPLHVALRKGVEGKRVFQISRERRYKVLSLYSM